MIIDGGSTDGTLDIIKAYNDKIDYWISEPDDGISDAFNKGINISTGMMIGIINAGDWYELNTIELVASVIRVTDVDIVHGKLQYWHKEQQSEQVSGNHNFLDKDMTVNHMTVFIRRELLKKIGVFSTKFQYAMDYELLLRAVNYGASFFI
uniref:Glycosyltransferase 2-like domain-containing protein n=1 Tax=uncultured Desulfobacterium sp. TaxID=201089 RepID=E1YHD3_9BACT|nr:hypothetical protein N47_F16720 [uncultured Desulfobacterium sp.]